MKQSDISLFENECGSKIIFKYIFFSLLEETVLSKSTRMELVEIIIVGYSH